MERRHEATGPEDAWAATVIGLLPSCELDLAALIVLADGHLDDAALARALAAEIPQFASAIAVLADLGLIRRLENGRVIVAHAYIRAALLQALPDARRRRSHAEVAVELDAAGATAGLVSMHIEASGAPHLIPHGICRAVDACRTSLRVGELDAALDMLDRVERLSGGLAALAPS